GHYYAPGGRYEGYVRVNGRRTYCDFSDRYDGYDKSIHDSNVTSLRNESYSHDEFGDDSGDLDNDWQEHSLSAMDDGHRDDSASPRSYRQHSPDGNVWQRTGRRGKKSYPHPVDRDDNRPGRRQPDWHDLQPAFPEVWRMIDDILRPDEKRVFVQFYLEKKKCPEIARTSRPKISKQAAYRLLKKATKKLQARAKIRLPNPFSEEKQLVVREKRTFDI